MRDDNELMLRRFDQVPGAVISDTHNSLCYRVRFRKYGDDAGNIHYQPISAQRRSQLQQASSLIGDRSFKTLNKSHQGSAECLADLAELNQIQPPFACFIFADDD